MNGNCVLWGRAGLKPAPTFPPRNPRPNPPKPPSLEDALPPQRRGVPQPTSNSSSLIFDI
ncbi:MAG: hypothetical protein LBM98_07435 [Oscillospiraceae bacterium]|nr:hypothetical protein [Oscillospiraceae bacterium]